MNRCVRCHRYHSPRMACGIPPVGRAQGRSGGFGNAQVAKGKPRTSRLSTATLEDVLAYAQGQYKKVVEMLKQIPSEVDLLDRESNLTYLINQLNHQIGVRR